MDIRCSKCQEIVEVDTSSGEFVELHKGDELNCYTHYDDYRLKYYCSVCLDDTVVGELPSEFAEKIERGEVRDLSVVVAQDYLNNGDRLVVELEYDGESYWREINERAMARESAGVVLSDEGKVLRQVPKGIESVTIPSTVCKIGDYAFDGCNKLRTLTIPDSVERIGTLSFQNCNALEELALSEGLKQIGRCAFMGCRSLRKVQIPESVENIEPMAFKYCSSLSEVRMPSGIRHVGFEVFTGCDLLNGQPILSGDGKFLFAWPDAKGDVIVPDGVEEINAETFRLCSKLESVKIPLTVKHVGEKAFMPCARLRKIIAPTGVDLSSAVMMRMTVVERY